MLQYYPSRLLVRTVDPASEPLALADAKTYLRVDTTNDDTLITGLITAARAYGEEYMRRSLITQTWKLAYDGCLLLNPAWRLPFVMRAPVAVALPRGPVTAVISVTAFAQDGTSTTISSSAYVMDAAQNALIFFSPVIAQRVEIVYTAGYGSSASNVPLPIVEGMQSHIGAMYDQRGDASSGLPAQSIALYAPYRDMRL